MGSIPGSGRSPGEGHGNPLQYFCLENPMDRGPWRAIVDRVAQSRTRLKGLSSSSSSEKGKSESEVAQSCPTLCNPMDCIAYQVPQSMEFSRQEYWSGLPFPSPRDLPDPGIEPGSSTLQADSLLSEPPGKPKCNVKCYVSC